MSRICQLSIRGIRNFDDEREGPIIRFSRPLTLILGPNGTGKTTIIECLKYALSGEFPPGTTGGKSFIHDPMLKKLAAIRVRGNVKAEIADFRGDKLTISRTVEAARINKNVRFKTLDSTLSRVNRKTGEKTVMSGTCASVDIELLASMGVSKAILNYVLFCHQDDANWPFEAGKKLKERFDEIFDTTRYNKALDSIRKMIKDKHGEIKVLIAEQRGFMMVVDEVKSKKKKLKDFETRKQETQEKIDDLKNKLRPINQRLSELKEIEMDYCKWQIEEEKKKMEYKLLIRQITSLRNEIKDPYKGTTLELSNEIISYQDMLLEKNNQIVKLEREVQEKTLKEARMFTILGERKVAVGTLKQQLHDQTIRLSKRNDTLKEIITSWELNETIKPDISENEVADLMKIIEQKLREMEENIEAKRIEHDREIDTLQRQVNMYSSEKTTVQSQLANSKRELQNIRADIRTNCALLKQAGDMEEKLNDVDARLAEANEKFEEFNETSEIDSLKCKIEDATIQEEIYEQKYNKVDKEMHLLREQGSLQTKLESYNAELLEKEGEIERLKEKHESTLEMLLGTRSFPSGGMMNTINEIQTVLNDRMKNLRKEIDAVQYETMKVKTSLKHKREQLEKKITEVENDKKKVSLHCGEYTNYREVLLMSSKRVKDIEDKRGMYAHQGAAYKEYIKKLSEPESCCPLCHRGFNDKNDSEQLITEMKNDMHGHPERLMNCERELAQQRKKYDALLQLQPIVEKIEHFEQDEMNKMRQEISESSKLLSISTQKGKRLQESLAEPERKLSVCKDMVGDMALWDRYANEIDGINISIIEIHQRLRDAGLKSDKSIQEAQKELDNLQQLMKDTRREMKDLQASLDSRNEELRRVTKCRTKLLEEQLRISKEMQDIKRAKESLDGLRAKETSIENSVQSFDKRLIEIGKQYLAAVKNLEQAKKNIRAVQDFDRNITRERSKEFDKINSMQTEVNNFFSRKIDEQLRATQEKLENAEALVNKSKSERAAVEAEIAQMKQDIAFNDTKKRYLNDNLTMRQKENEAETLKVECDILKEKLKEANYETASKERKSLCERRDSMERERNIARGNEEELDRNIAQLSVDLSRKEYRRAQSNYKKKSIELVLSRLCVHDLTLYCKVLDGAMIQYHEERMSTVNKSMKKLWDLIYTGTDTSSIQIRTEATSTTDKRRQFNYKLVQIKHGVEMDMKGRCSAGQRVLASIILRLALAETFCEQCGVLALDEPTTNLDEDNARSLADALHSYVHSRAKFQKNFQLIVITHDDNFIQKLGELSSRNSFYQLFRYDNGLSGIRCVSLDGPGVSRNAEIQSSEDEDDGSETSKRARSSFDDKPSRKRPKKKHIFE